MTSSVFAQSKLDLANGSVAKDACYFTRFTFTSKGWLPLKRGIHHTNEFADEYAAKSSHEYFNDPSICPDCFESHGAPNYTALFNRAEIESSKIMGKHGDITRIEENNAGSEISFLDQWGGKSKESPRMDIKLFHPENNLQQYLAVQYRGLNPNDPYKPRTYNEMIFTLPRKFRQSYKVVRCSDFSSSDIANFQKKSGFNLERLADCGGLDSNKNYLELTLTTGEKVILDTLHKKYNDDGKINESVTILEGPLAFEYYDKNKTNRYVPGYQFSNKRLKYTGEGLQINFMSTTRKYGFLNEVLFKQEAKGKVKVTCGEMCQCNSGSCKLNSDAKFSCEVPFLSIFTKADENSCSVLGMAEEQTNKYTNLSDDEEINRIIESQCGFGLK